MSIKVMTAVWERSKAKGSTLLLLLAIADHAHDDFSGAYPSVRTLAKKTRMSDRNVQNLIKDAVDLGELKVDYNAGKNGSNLYTITLGGAKFSPVKNEAVTGEKQSQEPVNHSSPEPSLEPLEEPDGASKIDAPNAIAEFDALPSASESQAQPMSEAAKEFFKQFHRSRWATQAQRDLFERTEADVGVERMLEAVRWGAESGISRVTSICTAARNGRKNVNGNGNGKGNGYKPKMLPEDRGVRTSTREMLDMMRRKGYFDRDGTIQSDN